MRTSCGKREARRSIVTPGSLIDRLLRDLELIAVGWKPDFSITYWNRGAEVVFGYRAEEVMGRDWIELLIPEEGREEARTAYRSFLCQEVAGVVVTHKVDRQGRQHAIYCQSIPFLSEEGEILEVISIGYDLTEELERKRELMESQTLQRDIIEHLAEGLVVFTPELEIIAHNQKGLEFVFGSEGEMEEVDGRILIKKLEPAFTIDGRPIPPEEVPGARALFTGQPHSGMVVKYMEGKPCYFRVNAVPRLSEEGKVEWVVFTALDVSEEYEILNELIRSELTFRTLVENLSVGVLLFDRRGRLISYNRAASELGGLRADHLGKKLGELFVNYGLVHVPGEASPPDSEKIYRDFLHGRGFHYEQVLLEHKVRGRRWYRASGIPVRGEGEHLEYFIITFEDITEEVEEAERRWREQRLSALGTLAGGVAHDFNNILAAILAAAELLRDYKLPKEADEVLMELVKAASQGKELVSQLLTLARPGEGVEDRQADLDRAVAEVVDVVEETVGEEVELVHRPAGEALGVGIGPAALKQVVRNLIQNAIEAVQAKGEPGRVVVSTRRERVEGEADLESGEYGVLEVSDTGIGMSQETISHIFEPFFTTKRGTGMGGTGLGLAIAYRLITDAGGTIRVSSEPGKGSTFTVFLPLRRERTREAEERPAAGEEVRTERFRVLLVEDNQLVRVTTQRVLEGRGMECLAAGGGEEAIRLARGAGELDVALVDLDLPDMPGEAVAARLREIYPRLGIVIVSGYVPSGAELERQLEKVEIVTKPFTTEELVAAIGRAVKGAREMEE